MSPGKFSCGLHRLWQQISMKNRQQGYREIYLYLQIYEYHTSPSTSRYTFEAVGSGWEPRTKVGSPSSGLQGVKLHMLPIIRCMTPLISTSSLRLSPPSPSLASHPLTRTPSQAVHHRGIFSSSTRLGAASPGQGDVPQVPAAERPRANEGGSGSLRVYLTKMWLLSGIFDLAFIPWCCSLS